ncbi:B-cell receptor CD22-like [Erpetoichthys calabaricus]|uniref:B-cell receptor CD22-like n=1 Tax=Erpetoichthys calabaricus TaxID=27687 RepID=UPI00223432FE|nr:B-cell receptor CD22-like [Erpetoichthys calabaricus]
MNMLEMAILLLSLTQGGWCTSWTIQMPPTITAVRGSCVLIPCKFSVPDKQTGVGSRFAVSWKKGRTAGATVSTSAADSNDNLPRVEVIGDLLENNCTSIMTGLRKRHTDVYFFRSEEFRYTYPKGVKIDVTDSPDKPIVSEMDAVQEGTVASLNCTAAVPCPAEPPDLQWNDTLNGNVTQIYRMNEDGTASLTSTLTFVVSHEHHRKKIKCTAQYEIKNRSERSERSVTVRVQYAPKETLALADPLPGLKEGDSVTLHCTSNSNPTSSYLWFQVNETTAYQRGSGQNLTLTTVTPSDHGRYYCQARNEHGDRNSTEVTLDVQYSPRRPSVSLGTPEQIWTGQSVTLTCTANANPKATFKWFKVNPPEMNGPPGQGGARAGDEQSLNFKRVKLEDNGRYYCKAKNKLGEAVSTQVTLEVQYRKESGVPVWAIAGGLVCGLTLLIIGLIVKRLKTKRNKTEERREKVDSNDDEEGVYTEIKRSLDTSAEIDETENYLCVEGEQEVHYANLDYAKLCIKNEGREEWKSEEWINVHSENVIEYAQVKFSQREETVGSGDTDVQES